MKPIALSIARAPARSGPSVRAAEWRLAGSVGRSYGCCWARAWSPRSVSVTRPSVGCAPTSLSRRPSARSRAVPRDVSATRGWRHDRTACRGSRRATRREGRDRLDARGPRRSAGRRASGRSRRRRSPGPCSGGLTRLADDDASPLDQEVVVAGLALAHEPVPASKVTGISAQRGARPSPATAARTTGRRGCASTRGVADDRPVGVRTPGQVSTASTGRIGAARDQGALDAEPSIRTGAMNPPSATSRPPR